MNKITSINGTLIASLNELNEHVENGTAHVTEEERTAWNNQTTVKAKGILIATQEDLDEHTGNKAIHVTEDERTTWNAKADAAALSAKADASSFNVHKDDAVAHMTAKERETWNDKQDKLTDAAGNMTLAGSLTVGRTINANDGVNIPPSVSPLLTGAVSNNELLDYLVDRTMRMSPYVTTVPAIVLKDYIDAENSTKNPWVNVGLGMIGIKGWGIGLNAEWRVRFKGGIFAEMQDGPMHYYDSVAIFSAPTLLNMSYLTSPGAVAQISFVKSGGYCFGVRLINKDGAAHYEMFYRTGEQDDEVVAISEPKPDYVNLYSGALQPKYKMQSLAIFLPRDGTQYAVVEFGPWSMRVPFVVYSDFSLDLMVRQGEKNISYYGANLSARLATITHICLGYNDQFIPTLNNNAYKS